MNVYLYIKIPKGFFPQQDTGRLNGQVQGQQHISFAALVEKAAVVRGSRCAAIPMWTPWMRWSGGGGFGRGGGNSAQIFCQLKPLGVAQGNARMR